ncbi:cysteamine dioxygenase [Tanacetum coccineum]
MTTLIIASNITLDGLDSLEALAVSRKDSSRAQVVFQNPLYIHPSDGPSSLTVQEKLTGAQNYKAWKRALEIGLSTKRKLGFVKGTVVCSATDENLAEL